MIRFEAILRVTYNYQNYLQTLGRWNSVPYMMFPWVPREGFFLNLARIRSAEATNASDDGVIFRSPLQLRRRGSLRGFATHKFGAKGKKPSGTQGNMMS